MQIAKHTTETEYKDPIATTPKFTAKTVIKLIITKIKPKLWER